MVYIIFFVFKTNDKKEEKNCERELSQILRISTQSTKKRALFGHISCEVLSYFSFEVAKLVFDEPRIVFLHLLQSSYQSSFRLLLQNENWGTYFIDTTSSSSDFVCITAK